MSSIGLLTISFISQVTDPIFQIPNPDTRSFGVGVGVGVGACVCVGINILVVSVEVWAGPKWGGSRLVEKLTPLRN